MREFNPASGAIGNPVRHGRTRLTWVTVGFAAAVAMLAFSAVGVRAGPGTPVPSLHWAFQPVVEPDVPVPSVPGLAEALSPVDAFLEAGWRRVGIRPAPRAERGVLLRRVFYDLTGLPPSPEEVAGFEADDAPDAFGRVIEQLLASPRYGERWGRYWMDVVRYADTAGDNADYPVPEAFRYRDYIIDAFNHDKPYDRFVLEQIAGDVLARGRSGAAYAEGVVATGFLALSRRYGTGPYELWHLTLENTIETLGQAFMGVNLKCARCHDHKFDPLTMRDYYGLYGIFAGTQFPWAGSEEVQSKQFNRQEFPATIPDAEAEPRWDAWRRRLAALKEAVALVEKEPVPGDAGAAEARKRRLADLQRELRTLEKPGAPPDVPVAYAVREGKGADVPVQLAGEPSRSGPTVPRCPPLALGGGPAGFILEPGSSGRLELARWLVQPEHPLTARVFVNRLWQHHFGVGLVETPNHFGLRSEPPGNRELLDFLAARLVRGGWSVKAMHRLILNSAAYQRSSADVPRSREKDPANRLCWRQARRRLDAEAIRDGLLQVSGRLDLSRPGAHPFPGPEKWTWTQHNPFKERYDSNVRSVYLMTQRFQKHPFLALFDGPDTNHSTEARRVSTVPQQALFAMNNRFLNDCAEALAKGVLDSSGDDEGRLSLLVGRAWGRPADPNETRLFLGALASARDASTENAGRPGREHAAWTTLARVVLTANEFFYVD